MDKQTPSPADRPAGGCLCRTVRFMAGSAPITARACWCRLCQSLGAGGPTVNVAFATEGFTVSGEVRWHESIADSGNRMARGFCPTCGTPLFSKAEARPQLIFVRAGALDDPEIGAPQMTIWTAAAPGWACFDPALPALEGQPPPAG